MQNWLSSFICVLAFGTAFVILTLLAHRTKVHARHERVVGLGISVSIVTTSSWLVTNTLANCSPFLVATLITSLTAFCIVYAYIVLESRSIWRYAGVGLAALLWIVSWVMDIYSSYHFLTWSSSLLAITVAINFLGHLLRARVNKALLRAPRQYRIQAPKISEAELSFHAISLFIENSDWVHKEHAKRLLEGLTVSSHDLPTVVDTLFHQWTTPTPIEKYEADFSIEKRYHLSALLPLICIWHHIFDQIHSQLNLIRYNLRLDSENVWLDLVGEKNPTTLLDTHALKKYVYDRSADLIDIEQGDTKIIIRIGYRLPY